MPTTKPRVRTFCCNTRPIQEKTMQVYWTTEMPFKHVCTNAVYDKAHTNSWVCYNNLHTFPEHLQSTLESLIDSYLPY